jgi:hypothetical protein
MLIQAIVFLFAIAIAVYWAQEIIGMIVQKDWHPEEAHRFALTSRLEFPRVRTELDRFWPARDLRAMEESIGHDFLAVSYFVRLTARGELAAYSFRERVLAGYFHGMRFLCASELPGVSRFALKEMIWVTEYFAGLAGLRMICEAEEIIACDPS